MTILEMEQRLTEHYGRKIENLRREVRTKAATHGRDAAWGRSEIWKSEDAQSAMDAAWQTALEKLLEKYEGKRNRDERPWQMKT